MALVLTPEIKELVNSGLTSGNPLALAVVTPDNKPSLSFRGSTQVYSDNQLGLWVRNTTGGTIEAIGKNPNVALIYHSATTPLLNFQGRARIATDAAERNRVFENSPERERNSDPERKGIAIIIDLDKVEGVLRFGANGPEFVKLAR
jgi:Pyridoxamine 5'-phosphate oxidase